MSIATNARAADVLFPHDRKFVSSETYDAFFSVVDRLEVAVDGETKALATRQKHDISTFTHQKRQGLLELGRIMHSMEKSIPNQDILTRLGRFKTRLEANEAMLSVHLSAVQDVTAIIVKVIRESESDGTYSQAYGQSDWDEP